MAILVRVAYVLRGGLDDARAVSAFSSFRFSHLRRAVSRNTRLTARIGGRHDPLKSLRDCFDAGFAIAVPAQKSTELRNQA
jgi:hypothetical protein